MQLEALPVNANIMIPKYSEERALIDWLGFWIQHDDGQNWHMWRQFPAGLLAPVSELPPHLQARGTLALIG